MRGAAKILAILLAGFIATSCEHKEIDCPGAATGINVLFEWDNAPDADVAGMSLFFYPSSGHGPAWRFDIAGRDGGPVELPSGSYRLIAFNNDLPGVSIRDAEKASTIRAIAARKVEENAFSTTGMLYGAVVSEIDITPCGVRYTKADGTVKECGRGLVRCRPDSLSTVITVLIDNVTGLERVRSASLVLSPVYSGMLLDPRNPTDFGGGLYMNLTADEAHKRLTGSGCAFGIDPSDMEKEKIFLRITTSSGKIVTRTVDVPREAINIITSHNVIVKIDGITVPGEDTPGDVGGIDAEVDGWDVVEVDVTPRI